MSLQALSTGLGTQQVLKKHSLLRRAHHVPVPSVRHLNNAPETQPLVWWSKHKQRGEERDRKEGLEIGEGRVPVLYHSPPAHLS